MSANQLKVVRISDMVLLALLVVQYFFGMLVNFSDPPSLAAFRVGDSNALIIALRAAGGLAPEHAVLGLVIWVIALVNLVLCLRTGIRSVQVLGCLAFLAVSLAGIGGTLFITSGFNNATGTKMMAGNFLFSYTFAFSEQYFLKGATGSKRTMAH